MVSLEASILNVIYSELFIADGCMFLKGVQRMSTRYTLFCHVGASGKKRYVYVVFFNRSTLKYF